MKKGDVYRFSLQFRAVDDTAIRVGDFLEDCGNRKSPIIIQAVAEYIERHQDELLAKEMVSKLKSTKLSDEMKSYIQQLINESLASTMLSTRIGTKSQDEPGPKPKEKDPATEAPEENIDALLDALSGFDL